MLIAFEVPAVERTWHIQESHGQILALALRKTPLNRSQFFPVCLKAARRTIWGDIPSSWEACSHLLCPD